MDGHGLEVRRIAVATVIANERNRSEYNGANDQGGRIPAALAAAALWPRD
jgi:hypothetical protein